MKINKAVFPVAGLGTRFLPVTKAHPKEMLPIVDKPLIQYAVEEAIEAGVRQLIFVTNSSKRAIEDHFDSNYELEATLKERGNYELLNIVRDILPAGVTCAYIRQTAPRGLGHAILCAKTLVMNEPFAVLLADDLIDAEIGCLRQMTSHFESKTSSMVAVQPIQLCDSQKYGMIDAECFDDLSLAKLKNIIEKPKASDAPSNMGVVGRYILTPSIFPILEEYAQANVVGEVQLTDAIAKLIQIEEVYAYQFAGKRFDCGSKLGYLEATVAYALKHADLADDFKNTLKAYQL